MYDMKNSEILNRTADVIEERGWGKGGRSMLGEDGVCVEGAMHLVLTGSLPASVMGKVAEVMTQDGTIHASDAFVDGQAYAVVESSPASRALKHYLDLWSDPLWAWNDYKVDDQQEIVEALRACALIEAAKEDGTYVEPEPATVAEAYNHLGFTEIKFSIPVTVCPVGGIKFESDLDKIKAKFDGVKVYSGDKLYLSVDPAATLATV